MSEILKRTPFIRLYDPSKDADPVHHICQATLPPALQDEPAFSIAPCIWAMPYVHLYPEYCFVVDSGSGSAVGYILGTPANKDFIAQYRLKYIPTLDTRNFPSPEMEKPSIWKGELAAALLKHLYTPEELLHTDFPTLIEEYPAHLHTDLLPNYQRQGFGRLLMDAFCGKLRQEGVRGVHLIMAPENTNAMFYDRLGFKRFPSVLDGGATGEQGRHPEGIWLVKALC